MPVPSIPEFIGYTFMIHDGRKHVKVLVTEEMVGHKLGEFAPTRTFKGHGRQQETLVVTGCAVEQRRTDEPVPIADSNRTVRSQSQTTNRLERQIKKWHSNQNTDTHGSARERFARWPTWFVANLSTRRWTFFEYQPHRGARMLEKVIQQCTGQRTGS